jgi:predicted RNase H-like HicB family nuclease
MNTEEQEGELHRMSYSRRPVNGVRGWQHQRENPLFHQTPLIMLELRGRSNLLPLIVVGQYNTEIRDMKLKAVIHKAEEGGYWAEVPAIPGCATQGEDMRDLIENVYDAVEGCLSVDMDTERKVGAP